MEAKMPPADADETGQPSENEWLGVTFRTSKTFVVAADDGHAHFPDGTALTMAHDEQRKEFYTLRARENAEVLFAYPRLAYTLSESDLMPPVDPPLESIVPSRRDDLQLLKVQIVPARLYCGVRSYSCVLKRVTCGATSSGHMCDAMCFAGMYGILISL